MKLSESLRENRLPINNPFLLGQGEAEQKFLSSFFSKRIPHAWLLTGPKGIGKATFAHRIARFVLTNTFVLHEEDGLFSSNLDLDKKATNLNHDINDPICRRIISGGHPDFLHITRTLDEKSGKIKQQITVDEIRKINSFLSLTPSEGGWRIIVIDSIDDFNTNSSNAILKVLEEPPLNTLILLICHNSMSVLETIKSRCRLIKLKLLDEDVLVSLLKEYQINLSMDESRVLSGLSDGSIGKALHLAEGATLEVFNQIKAILNTFPKIDMLKVHELGNTIVRDKTGDLFTHVMHFLANWVANNVKKSAISDLEDTYPWLDTWDKMGDSLDKLTSLNLDQKQVLLNTFVLIKNVNKNSKSVLGQL